jgi:hypothetical protein
LPNWKARVIKKNLGKSIFSWYTFRVSNWECDGNRKDTGKSSLQLFSCEMAMLYNFILKNIELLMDRVCE